MVLRAMFQEGGYVDEDEEATKDLFAGEDDAYAMSSLDPEQDMLTARAAVGTLNKSTADARKALSDARAKLLARKYDRTSALLAIATGLTRPTKTGGFSGFAESLGNMGAALQEPVKQKRDFEREKIQDLLGIDTSMYGLDQKTAESAIKLAQIRARMTQLSRKPSAIQIWDLYQSLSPEKRVQLLETMRNPNVTYKENEGVMTRLDPRAATHPDVPGITEKTPMTTLDKEAAAQSTLAEAKESGKTIGEKTSTAQYNLPDVENSANYLVDTLGKLRDHPGMPWAVGAVQVPAIWGSKVADFQALLKQVGGQQFLKAYDTLRGTGQITEVEGQQGKEAIARMQTAQSEKAFISAANEFIDHVKRSVELARIHANQGTINKPSEEKVRRYDKNGKRIQ